MSGAAGGLSASKRSKPKCVVRALKAWRRQIGDQGADARMTERLEVDVEKVVALALQIRQDMPAGLAGSPGEYHALAWHLLSRPSLIE